MSASPVRPFFRLDYGSKLEREIDSLLGAFSKMDLGADEYPGRWLAIKLLEGDAEIIASLRELPMGDQAVDLARKSGEKLRSLLGEDAEMLIADKRYGFINGVVRQTLKRPRMDRVTLTERIDDIVTNRWAGLPVFFMMMYVVFRLVIDVSAPFTEWMDFVINDPIASWITAILEFASAPAWIRSLVVDAVIGGVGGVLVFVPGLMILYFFLAVLEDSGYMSRAAFVMDRFMRVVGLHGKSFIPMILGFGCAVPAVYATRTISSRRDRILTALLVPLMSCSARLPVYVVFGLAFFGSRAGTVIWALYALGILVAMLAGMVFTRTILRPDVSSAFVLELPPYRQPALKSLLIHTWGNTREFVRKAGTTIVLASFVMWLMLNLPWGVTDRGDSYFGRVSGIIAPVFEPMGFGDWQTGGALVTGFMAKELVVSAMSQIYMGGETSPSYTRTFAGDLDEIGARLADAAMRSLKTFVSILPGIELTEKENASHDTRLSRSLREHFSPLAATAFLVFVLLYVPCVATLGAIRHEFGTAWALTSAVYQTVVAWAAAFAVHSLGVLLGFA